MFTGRGLGRASPDRRTRYSEFSLPSSSSCPSRRDDGTFSAGGSARVNMIITPELGLPPEPNGCQKPTEFIKPFLCAFYSLRDSRVCSVLTTCWSKIAHAGLRKRGLLPNPRYERVQSIGKALARSSTGGKVDSCSTYIDKETVQITTRESLFHRLCMVQTKDKFKWVNAILGTAGLNW
jgi:hypothetical protein